MGSSGNLSKLVIPKQHWQECKDKGGYSKETGMDSRGAGGQQQQQQQLRSKMQWWVAFCLCVGLVVVPFLMFMCAIDNMEALGSKRQPWISLDGPPLEFIGVHSRWSLLRGGRGSLHEETKARAALQGMGTLHRVGTRAMQELVVAHLTEDTSSEELRLFLRSLHRSGSTARADVVLLFPCSPMPAAMAKVIQEEEDSFQKLLVEFKPHGEEAPSGAAVAGESASADADSAISPFNATAFIRRSEDEQQELVPEIIWGKRHSATPATTTTEGSNAAGNPSTPTSWASWGSVVSFDIQELDPQDALQGFFDTPPAQLRRWLCYDMLLGMVKSRYKNVLVSQVTGVYVLGDALSALRKKPTLYITAEDNLWRDATREPVAELEPETPEDALRATVVDLATVRHESIRRSLRESSKLRAPDDSPVKSEAQGWRHAQGLIQSVYGPQVWGTLEAPDKERVVVSSAVIMGGVQYVRGLASKMTSEIVRVAMERKSRRTFHDKAVLNMWVHKKAALGKRIADHLKVVKNQDSVVHSVRGSLQSSLYWRKRSRYLVVHDQERAGPSQLRQELCRLDPRLYQRCS